MSTRLAGVIGVALAVGLVAAGIEGMNGAEDNEIAPVRVTNFPETQRVEGSVKVSDPVPLAALASFRNVEVPPRALPGSIQKYSAGTLTTDGFGAVVLSLAVNLKGRLSRSGEVGVLLLPDEEPRRRAYEVNGVSQFALELKLTCDPGGPLCSSVPARHVVGFPRYKVFVFNTTDRFVTVDLYAYLTH